jgi:hypothetical protein
MRRMRVRLAELLFWLAGRALPPGAWTYEAENPEWHLVCRLTHRGKP